MSLREIDILTGLHTPGFLVAYGARALSNARNRGGSISLLTISLDVDSGQGLEIPPVKIRRVGELIRMSIGPNSVVALIGDNELAVLLQGKDTRFAGKIADTILSTIGNELSIRDISIGVATSTDGITDFSDLLKASEVAMERV